MLCELAKGMGLQIGASPITMFGAAQQFVSQQIAAGQLLGRVRAATATVLCGGWGAADFRLSALGWKAHRRFSIGSLRDVGVYPIHLLSAWFGPVAAVSAFCADTNDQDDKKKCLRNDEWKHSEQTAVDCWTVTLRFQDGIVATILSSLSLSAKGADEAYCLTLRGDRGALTLNAMWNGRMSQLLIAKLTRNRYSWKPEFWSQYVCIV